MTGMRAMMAFVACCALIVWAARVMRESPDPALAEERAIEARAVRALRSRRATERLGAIQALDRLSFADGAVAIRPLTAMLGDEDPGVRVASVEALGRIGARAVPDGSDDAAVRDAVTALIGLLKDPQPVMRTAAASALGIMTLAKPRAGTGPRRGPPPPGGKNAAPVPVAAVPTPVDREAVIAALTEALGDRDAKVRGAAIFALAADTSISGPPKALAAGLADESAENREATVMALARFPRGLDPWITPLLRIAEHDDDRSVRRATVGVLIGLNGTSTITPAAVPALTAGLGSGDPQIRTLSASILSRLGTGAEAAIPALLRVFAGPIDGEGAGFADEGRAAEALNAADTLGFIAPGTASAKQVVTAFTEVARLGKGLRQAKAAWALGAFGQDAAPAIPALIQMAREAGPDHDSDNVQAAAWALGRIAPGTPAADEVVAALADVLRSDRASSRVAAIEALRQFGPKAAVGIPRLRALREDPNIEVRQAAEHALGDEGKP